MKPGFDEEGTLSAEAGHRTSACSGPLDTDTLWRMLTEAARAAVNRDPLLSALYRHILLEVPDFASALARVIADTLTTPQLPERAARERVEALLDRHPAIAAAAERDLVALLREDAAIPEPFTPLLFFPGYQAVQCHRIAHQWWLDGVTDLASHLQYRAAVRFSADIHRAATLGAGLFVDHGAGIVIGETAVVEDDVTIFHGVTLGSSGKVRGDRHPKVRRGAFLGAGATILGNIEIGEDARIGAAAVVTRSVAAGATVIGPAARPR